MNEPWGFHTRIAGAVLLSFWLVMNGLLWRAEYGVGHEPGGPVPLELVARKLLTAPDYSTLDIRRRGKKIGYVRWAPDIVAQTRTARPDPGDPESAAEPGRDFRPEGMIPELSGFHIEIDGGLSDDSASGRIRFDARIELSQDRALEQAHFRLIRRPAVWVLDTSIPEENLTIEFRNGETEWKRILRFDQLENPDRLLTEILGPAAIVPAGLLSGLGWNFKRAWGADLKWDSRSDWLKFGGSRVRIYRLHGRWMDRYDVVMLLSRAGEILKITLPGDVELRNEAMIWHD